MVSTVDHAKCSLLMPKGYQGEVTSSQDNTQTWSVIQAATHYELPPLLDRVGEWAVCVDGLYCLTSNYPIPADRLDEPDWIDHMKLKSWVKIDDFAAALERARAFRRCGYISVRFAEIEGDGEPLSSVK
jgi:hypothetical protein